MATFPAFTPNERSFKPGVYPQRTYRSLSGVLVRRTFGSLPYGAQVELSYNNVPDDTVAQILNHYHTQTAANERFNLPTNVTAAINNSVIEPAFGTTAETGNLRWEYAEPPAVDSVRNGIYRLRVVLNGEIRDPNTDDD